MASNLEAYLSGTQDPSSVATYGETGQVFIQTGVTGFKFYQKQDNGLTTNWSLLSISEGASGYYPVFPGGPYSSIQDAINQAVLDGYGGFNVAVVDLISGIYTENVDIVNGIALVCSNPGGSLIEGRVRYVVPTGGVPAGTAAVLFNIHIRQQAGLNGILMQGAPGDFGVLVLENCTVTSFLAAEPNSAIEVNGALCVFQAFRTKGFSLSNDPGFYFFKLAGLRCFVRDTSMNVNTQYLYAVSGSNQVSNLALNVDGNPAHAILIGSAATCILSYSQINMLQAFPQIGVQLEAGCTFYSVYNSYTINIDAGSRCVAGPIGSVYNSAFDSYPFSDQISAAMTYTPIDTVPTPV